MLRTESKGRGSMKIRSIQGRKDCGDPDAEGETPETECQNFEGTAKANICPLSGCTWGASSTKVKNGDASTPCIRAELFSRPIGVCGDAGVAGDVVFE